MRSFALLRKQVNEVFQRLFVVAFALFPHDLFAGSRDHLDEAEILQVGSLTHLNEDPQGTDP